MCRNPSDWLPAPVRDEKLRAGMSEERVLFRIDEFQLFRTQLRDRMLEPRGEGPPKVDKPGAGFLVLAVDCLNAYLRIRHVGVFRICSKSKHLCRLQPSRASQSITLMGIARLP